MRRILVHVLQIDLCPVLGYNRSRVLDLGSTVDACCHALTACSTSWIVVLLCSRRPGVLHWLAVLEVVQVLPAVLHKPDVEGESYFFLPPEAIRLFSLRLHWNIGTQALPSTYLYRVALDVLDESAR